MNDIVFSIIIGTTLWGAMFIIWRGCEKIFCKKEDGFKPWPDNNSGKSGYSGVDWVSRNKRYHGQSGYSGISGYSGRSGCGYAVCPECSNIVSVTELKALLQCPHCKVDYPFVIRGKQQSCANFPHHIRRPYQK